MASLYTRESQNKVIKAPARPTAIPAESSRMQRNGQEADPYTCMNVYYDNHENEAFTEVLEVHMAANICFFSNLSLFAPYHRTIWKRLEQINE